MKKVFGAIAAAMLFGFSVETSGQERLLVSELLFQPRSHEAEYVELYNGGNTSLELSDYHIVRWIGDSLGTHYPLPSHTLAAHDYVVLTKDAASVMACYTVKYASKIVECKLPAYPNGGGSVVLATADSVVVEKFDYRPEMHSRLLRNKAGVALERRSYDRPANEGSNWFSAASTVGYGTPGYANSQSSEYLVEERCFDFSATRLSPDGDDYEDELVVEYRLDEAGLGARCEVYDARGVQVRRLLNNDLLGSHGQIIWNGRNDQGQLLPTGQYLLVLTLFDTEGTRQILRRTITLWAP